MLATIHSFLDFIGFIKREPLRCFFFQHINSQGTKADRRVSIECDLFNYHLVLFLPGVLLLIAAAVLGKTGVTTGGGIPAAISKRG